MMTVIAMIDVERVLSPCDYLYFFHPFQSNIQQVFCILSSIADRILRAYLSGAGNAKKKRYA